MPWYFTCILLWVPRFGVPCQAHLFLRYSAAPTIHLGVVGRPRHQHGHAHTLPDTCACPHLPTPALAVYRCTLHHSTPSTPHAVLHQTRPPCLPSGPPRAMGRPCTLTTLEHTRPSYTRLSAGARSSSRMPLHSCHSHTTRANYAQHTSCAIYIYPYMYIYLYICAAEL